MPSHNSENLDYLEPLTGVTWNILTSTPLFDYKATEIQFKKYEKWLRDKFLARFSHKITAASSVQVVFGVDANLSYRFHESFQIQIIVGEKEIYLAHFLQNASAPRKSPRHIWKYKSLVMTRGNVAVSEAMRAYVEQLFDCCIRPIDLSGDFDDLTAALCKSMDAHDNYMAVLTYVKDKDKVTFSLESSVLSHLANRNSAKFHNNIRRNFGDHFFILNYDFKLVKVSLPGCIVEDAGRFRVNRTKSVNVIIDFLGKRR